MLTEIPNRILDHTEIKLCLGEYLELIERVEAAERTIKEIGTFAENSKHDKWDIGKYILDKFEIPEEVKKEEQNVSAEVHTEQN